MKALSTGLMAVALAAAVLVAANMSPYPAAAVVCLMAVGCISGLVSRRAAEPLPVGGWLVVAAAVWFAAGVWRSPVADFGRADAILMAGGLLVYLWVVCVAPVAAQRGLVALWSVLGVAAVAVAVYQANSDPSFSPVYGERATTRYPSGFHGHYNYFSNWLCCLLFPCLAMGLDPNRVIRWRRIAWLVAAAALAGGIVLSRSRGAVLAAGVGFMVWLVFWVIALRRRFPAWRGALTTAVVVLLPLLAAGGVWFGRMALAERGVGAVEGAMTQDSGRLEFAKMAIEQTMDHPWTGAGSRSFSYELLRYWDPQELWTGSFEIVMVHNEFLQAAADYGWPALLLLGCMAGAILFRAMVVAAIRGGESTGAGADTALVAGAAAGVVAMLTQSCFDFVFHLLPNLVGLALLAGIIDRQPWPAGESRSPGVVSRWLAAGLCAVVAAAIPLVVWRDAAAAAILKRQSVVPADVGPDKNLERLERAVAIRPDQSLWLRIGNLCASLAVGADEKSRELQLEAAAQAYWRSLERHPYDWLTAVNLARVLDCQGKYDEAATLYRKVIPLTDCRELYYRARFYHGCHLYLRGLQAWEQGERQAAAALLEQALAELRKSRQIFVYTLDSQEGRMLGLVEDMEATVRYNGVREDYGAALKAWDQRRPGRALTLALPVRDALRALTGYGEGAAPPESEARKEAAALLPKVDEFIAFLEGAGIKRE